LKLIQLGRHVALLGLALRYVTLRYLSVVKECREEGRKTDDNDNDNKDGVKVVCCEVVKGISMVAERDSNSSL
jgi:hypothetical protein